jgi:hypothetical protein
VLTIDGRCGCSRCEERTQNIYRMVGSCSNCGTSGILILYRAGDPVADQDCPVCEGSWTVRGNGQRLATPEEIPVA